jgi:hypothetical protein
MERILLPGKYPEFAGFAEVSFDVHISKKYKLLYGKH